MWYIEFDLFKIMVEGIRFSRVLRKAAELQGTWLQNHSLIRVKPGIVDRHGNTPTAPITILGMPDKSILVERVMRDDILPLVPPNIHGNIKQDAFAFIYTDESGERVWIGNEECQSIIGPNLKLDIIVRGRDRVKLANLYQEKESRISSELIPAKSS